MGKGFNSIDGFFIAFEETENVSPFLVKPFGIVKKLGGKTGGSSLSLSFSSSSRMIKLKGGISAKANKIECYFGENVKRPSYDHNRIGFMESRIKSVRKISI